MKITLISLDAPQARLEIESDELPLVLGRSGEADVQFPDRWVSRRHCRLSMVGGALAVRDLRSRHGTLVNGTRITESVLLPDDRLALGSLHFAVSYEPVPVAPIIEPAAEPKVGSTECYEPTA